LHANCENRKAKRSCGRIEKKEDDEKLAKREQIIEHSLLMFGDFGVPNEVNSASGDVV